MKRTTSEGPAEIGRVLRLGDHWASVHTEPLGIVVLTNGGASHIGGHTGSPSDDVNFEHLKLALASTLFVLRAGVDTGAATRQMAVFDIFALRDRVGEMFQLDRHEGPRSRKRDLGAAVIAHMVPRLDDPPECLNGGTLSPAWTLFSMSWNGRRKARRRLAEREHVAWPKDEGRLLEIEELLDSPDRFP